MGIRDVWRRLDKTVIARSSALKWARDPLVRSVNSAYNNAWRSVGDALAMTGNS